jgi:hypothetical protein
MEHLGAHQVGREVPVAQSEPGRLDAVRRELLLDLPGLVLATPPALGVDAAAEGVHDRVEVRAHLESVQPDVVGGVRDDRDLGVGAAALDEPEQPLDEPGAPDTTRQDRVAAR